MEYIAHDTARVWKSEAGARSLDELMTVLYLGDGIDVLQRNQNATKVRLGPGREGWIRGSLRTTAAGPLALAFIDVGQGDACLMTTPSGHRVLIDGGENKLAARYLASRFWDETVGGNDVNFDAIVVTHGDADHFDGLSTLVLDAAVEQRERKRIRVTASRVFHNGLVKRGSSRSEQNHLGAAVDEGGTRFAPVLNDPRIASDANRHFQRWNRALDELAQRAPTSISRLDDQTDGAFDFLGDVNVSVLGPTVRRLKDGTLGLPLLAEKGSSSLSEHPDGVALLLIFRRSLELARRDVRAAVRIRRDRRDGLVIRSSSDATRRDLLAVIDHATEREVRLRSRDVDLAVGQVDAMDGEALNVVHDECCRMRVSGPRGFRFVRSATCLGKTRPRVGFPFVFFAIARAPANWGSVAPRRRRATHP